MQGTPPTPNGSAVGEYVTEGAGALQRILEGLAATHGRLTASALLVVALFLGMVVVPYVLGRARRVLLDAVVAGRDADAFELAARYAPTTFAGLLVRLVQLGVLVTVVLSVLVIWGFADVTELLVPYVDGSEPNLVKLVTTFLIVALAFVASDQLGRRVRDLTKRLEKVTEHQEEIMRRVGRLTIFVTAAGSMMTLWGVNLSGLLVGAGFLGIVVGLAARQTLGSMIAGFVLMFARPFTIGDWVEIDEEEGIVTDITIFNTRLENFDGEYVVIPNDKVSDRSVTNRSKKGLLRLRTDVGIDYDADPERAAEIARDAMIDVDAVAETPPPQVVKKAFGDSAVVLELRYWIDHPTPPRKWNAVSAVVTEVKAAFDEEDVTIPFPQRSVSSRDGDDEGAQQLGAVTDASLGSNGDAGSDGTD